MKKESEVEELPVLTEPVIIESGGRKFSYKFKQLCCLQIELAREAGEFRLNQTDNPPETFQQSIKSGGTDWLFNISRYLFREIKSGDMVLFNRDKAETDTDSFLKNLTGEDHAKLQEAVKDFFDSIEMSKTGSLLLSKEKSRNKTKELLALMTAMQNVSGKING